MAVDNDVQYHIVLDNNDAEQELDIKPGDIIKHVNGQVSVIQRMNLSNLLTEQYKTKVPNDEWAKVIKAEFQNTQTLKGLLIKQLEMEELNFFTIIPIFEQIIDQELIFKDKHAADIEQDSIKQLLITCVAYLIFDALSKSIAFDFEYGMVVETKEKLIELRHEIVSEALQRYSAELMDNPQDFWQRYERAFSMYTDIHMALEQELTKLAQGIGS